MNKETGFQKILEQVDRARNNKVIGIPMNQFTKIGRYLSIQKSRYTIIGGESGTGKSALCDTLYVLQPYLWYKKNQDNTDIKLKIIIRSMERSKRERMAKWVCLMLWQKHGILMDTKTMFGYNGHNNLLTDDVYQKIKECREFFEEMEDDVYVIDGMANPTGIYNEALEYAKSHGKIDKRVIGDEFTETTYTPNDDNLITLFIIDHIGKLKSERQFNKKQNIDKMSEYLTMLRDIYQFSPVVVQQFNRNIRSMDRRKNVKDIGELVPEPSDLKDSSTPNEDCDAMLGLFNPKKFGLKEVWNYDVDAMVNNEGFNRFRSIHILKNSYGADDVMVPAHFVGEVGYFGPMPSIKDLNPAEYYKLRNP